MLLIWEAAAFLVAAVVWLAAHQAPVNAVCGSDLNRVAYVQRSYATMGVSLSSATLRLREELKYSDAFESSAAFRVRFDRPRQAQVSRDFFEFLGVQPAVGRTLAGVPLDTALLTMAMWEQEFQGDRRIIGQRRMLDGRIYTIAGVLPGEFVFASRRIRFFTPLPEGTPAAGLLVRLRRGVTLERGEQMLRVIAPQMETGWRPDAFRLRPYLANARWLDTARTGLALALCGVAIGWIVLVWRTKISPLYLAYWAVRITLVVLALAQLSGALSRWEEENLAPLAVFHLWLFVALGAAAGWWLLRDQLNRCPVCLRRLRLPTGVGSWGSIVLDAPGIEYSCPQGHGFLYRDQGATRARWLALDESWRDLFVRK